MNQRTQEISSEGRKQKLVYDKEGNITERQLPQKMSYRYQYDSAGRLTAVIDPAGNTLETVSYDRAGRRVKVETAGGSGAEYAYTAAGWQTRIETKGGASQAYNYDAQGNVTGIIDGNGNETSYILDSWGRITEICKADGSKENYAYDFAGNITEAVDGNGNKRIYAFDDNNQLKSITYPDGSEEKYLYGIDGNISKFQDRNGIVNEYQWNVYGSMTERKAGDLRNVYEYAANGQLTAAISNGMDYRYNYDKDGLLTAKIASGRTLLGYTYDELGRKTSQTDISGRTVKYQFDKSNHLCDIGDEFDQSIVRFDRDADGAIEKITHANGMWQDVAYDADKNITSLTVATPDKLLAQNTYQYDGNGQRIEKNELTGKTLYTYDSLNRLAQAEYPTYTERFTYDHAGNRLTRTAKDIEEQYVYDVNNRLTRRTVNGQEENYRYDNAGNLLQDANNTYEYDAFRRTSKVTTKAGMTQVNRYDAEGLRYEMEENGKLVQFIFNENKEVIVEQEGDNITRLIRTSDLWAMESESEKTWYHYASDEQGSTIFITDRQGKVKNRYAYDAFGNTLEAEEQIFNRYQYTGQQFDQITQQYYLRARFYNPAIARFTQEDEYHGDGVNLYVYCANNPVGYYDPSGYSLISSEAFSDLVVKANREGIGGLSDSQVSDMAEYWRKNNPNPYRLSQEQAENVMRQGYKYPMEERVGTGLEVPKPESYLPNEHIENHMKEFENGASRFVPYNDFKYYKKSEYFQREDKYHSLYVASKDGMDNVLDSARNGRKYKAEVIEKGLGYDIGSFGDKPKRCMIIDISNPKAHEAHMPLGVEPGTNAHWVPGGYTEGMATEAVAYNIKNPDVVESAKDLNARDVTVRECKLIR